MNFKSSVASDDQWIADAIKKNEKAAYYGRNSIESTYNALQHKGFTHENCLKIINNYPDVLRLKPDQISQRLDIWQMAKFTPTQFYDLFVQCPELLEFDNEQGIAKRYAQLQAIVYTPKNIWRILMSCPNVLVDDISTIRAKTDYILNTMEADIADLVKSGSLGLPMAKIKTRHMLLLRMGIFKKRNSRSSELSTNKNLRLSRIMDVNDAEFATKTCGISIKEYEAFEELYEREMDEQIKEKIDYEVDSDVESDEEAESDDENFDPRENNDSYDDRHRRRYRRKK